MNAFGWDRFFFDAHLFHEFSQNDHPFGGSARPPFKHNVHAKREPSTELLAFDLLAQERMDFIYHRPLIFATRELHAIRPPVMLRVNDIKRKFVVDMFKPRYPG